MNRVDLQEKYKNLWYLMQDQSCIVNNVPSTKRHLEIAIAASLKANKKNIVIGGLRRIGKSVILKQLAGEFEKSIYISFEHASFKNNDSKFNDTEVIGDIIRLIKSGDIKLLLLDEVTRLNYYASSIKEVFDTANIFNVSVVKLY
jgi:predicted AAA+ superfamily ATPase